MVIKEKELARLMKDAYRGGGYTVAVKRSFAQTLGRWKLMTPACPEKRFP